MLLQATLCPLLARPNLPPYIYYMLAASSTSLLSSSFFPFLHGSFRRGCMKMSRGPLSKRDWNVNKVNVMFVITKAPYQVLP